MIKRTTADAAFSDCVRERAGWKCERCGKQPDPRGLHCAHIFSRGNWSVRFHPSNALSLCYGCHRYLDHHKSELIDVAKQARGEARIEYVHKLSKQPQKGVKSNLPRIAKWYREELKEMQELRRECSPTYKIQFNHWNAYLILDKDRKKEDE